MSFYSYKIDNVTMPLGITSFTPEIHNLYGEGTGRDEAGINHLELIRAGTRKWQIKHSFLTSQEMETLVNALKPKGFSVEAYHPLGNQASSCYGTAQVSMSAKPGSLEIYWDVDVSLIEN